jgi:MoxR-like ATPase
MKRAGTPRTGRKEPRVALLMEAAYESLADLRERAKAEVAKVVLGQDRAVELMLVAALARGHILLEGPPGSAKTLLGRAVAHMLGASFKRIQFTPDTTPAELTGTTVMRGGEPVFHPGAVFANVLLADEINRTPPRSQAALLEAMQERQVTVDGKAHRLPDPFLVIATQNPFEHEGVFVLPEAQLDRFLFKLQLEYPDADFELGMLNLPHNGIAPDMLGEVKPLLGVVGLDRARDELNTTTVSESVGRYVVNLARRTREVPGVELGVSSRGIMHLMSAAKANARLNGRDHVAVADVREMAPYVLRHRLIIEDPSLTPETALEQALDAIPAPVPTAVDEDAPLAPVEPSPPEKPTRADSMLLSDAPPVTEG